MRETALPVHARSHVSRHCSLHPREMRSPMFVSDPLTRRELTVRSEREQALRGRAASAYEGWEYEEEEH